MKICESQLMIREQPREVKVGVEGLVVGEVRLSKYSQNLEEKEFSRQGWFNREEEEGLIRLDRAEWGERSVLLVFPVPTLLPILWRKITFSLD